MKLQELISILKRRIPRKQRKLTDVSFIIDEQEYELITMLYFNIDTKVVLRLKKIEGK